MKFDDFLHQAWSDHATNAAEVASRLTEGIRLIDTEEQIPRMAALITHVLGEHLGRWREGISLLNQLKGVPALIPGSDAAQSVARSVASLEFSGGERQSLEDLSRSDQIRVLAFAASALSEQKDSSRAQAFFRQALEKAESGIPKDDPAHRALAVTGNNLACALEQRAEKTPAEVELMVLAALGARKFWEIAGHWLHVERAEYRLAQTYVNCGDAARAIQHARNCLALSRENDAPPLEFFFAHEALALAERARGNIAEFSDARNEMKRCFEKLSPEDQRWCKATLDKIS